MRAKFLKARGTIIPNLQFLLEIVTVPPISYSKVKPHIISFGCGVLIYGYAGEFALDTSRKVEEPVVKVNLFHSGLNPIGFFDIEFVGIFLVLIRPIGSGVGNSVGIAKFLLLVFGHSLVKETFGFCLKASLKRCPVF
jgi:hypothetical protein